MNTMNVEHATCHNCIRYINRIMELEKQLALQSDTQSDTQTDIKYQVDTDVEMSCIQQEEGNPNYLDLSYDRIENLVLKYYNTDLFFQGYRGIVAFIYSYIIRDDNNPSRILYTCIDPLKKTFEYHDENGTVKDNRCKNLLDALYEPIIKKVNKIYRININKIYEESSTEDANDEEEDNSDIEYDSDIEEIIASELQCEKTGTKSIDEKVNFTVDVFLEIKKSCKNRKVIIDELCSLLSMN